VCEWDSRDGKHHYIKKWPQRESLIPGQKNVANTPIINPKKVYLPPSHTKLGLIKYPVKADSARYIYVFEKDVSQDKLT
jgi:hypothetical protein